MKALPICSLQTLMSLASKSRDLFKEEHNDQAKLQEDYKAKARVEKQEIATKKLLEVEKPLSVFYILRIKTKVLARNRQVKPSVNGGRDSIPAASRI